MAKVDPFIVPLPAKLARDPQLEPYFQYLQKFLHDLWQRTGAGTDLISAQSDHGALTGLADDDHAQYLNETRHDALASDNPHGVTFTQAVTADGGTNISAAEAETLTDGSNASALHNHGATNKFWAFDSPAGSSGTFYWGGFYQFHTVSFTPAGGTTVGTVNSSYAAHALVVLGASSTDMIVRVTGTSINDSATRTTSDTEDIDTSGGSANAYYETSKKWIGQVSYSLFSGTGVVINAGFSKYWDAGNTDFTVVGLEVLWLAGANDSGANIELLHHTATGWTYGAGGTPTTPTPIASMNTDHVTEVLMVNGERGAWKRTGLSQAVTGSGSEGILWRTTTTANKAFELGNLQLDIT